MKRIIYVAMALLIFSTFCHAEGCSISLDSSCRKGQSGPLISDYFQDSALDRWSGTLGAWQVDTTFVDMYDIETRDIYISPEEPGWLEWVGLWQEKDGTIKTCFAQIMGNPALDPSYRPWYGRIFSVLKEKNWAQVVKERNMRMGPENAISTTKLDNITLGSDDLGESWENFGSEHKLKAITRVRSGDGGKTWQSEVVDELPAGGNLVFTLADDGQLVYTGNEIIRCRDGRLLSIVPSTAHKEGPLIELIESMDNGKTWTDTQDILPEGANPAIMAGISDEKDIVELDDGRIFVILRTDTDVEKLGLPRDRNYGPCQTYLTRIGPGKYEATPPTWTPMPHGGRPAIVRGDDGVIWYWAATGHWYSADDGETWRPAPEALICYSAKMLMTGPNQLLCVTQYLSHDSPYPYSMDSTIRQYRFSYRRSGVLQQTDTKAPLAMASRSEGQFKDLHIRADVQVDGANGLAFHVQPDGKSYYVFAVILPESEAYNIWFPPEAEAKKLAAPHAGEEEDRRFATGYPMCALGRVDNGKLRVLSATKMLNLTTEFTIDQLRPGDWVEMQVKVSGDLIQAAAKQEKEYPAIYVGMREASYASGKVGLLTDRSSGAFKNVRVWDRAQMIRDLWE